MKNIVILPIALLLMIGSGCGGGSMGSSPPPPTSSLSVSLSVSSITVFTGESSASVDATLTRQGTSASVNLTVTGVPSGASFQVQQPGTGNSGSVSLDPGTAAAGTYPVTIRASDGTLSGSASLSLIVGAVVQVASNVTGSLQLAMSTSFQPAEWDDQFFQLNPGATSPLGNLLPQHIRLQPASHGTPQKADQSWDFATLDAIFNPVSGVNDKSPELQLAAAPAWMSDNSGHILSAHFPDFANYAADLVSYYNTTTGFQDSGGMVHVHNPTMPTPVTYWGIFNEPNINGLDDPQQYTNLYNLTVPAMQAVDPTLKFVAVELADFSNWEQMYLPAFVNNVTAQVDVLATHFYSTCNQKDPDQYVFSTIPTFADGVSYIYSQLKTQSRLANVPVWITENNVNADYDKGGGVSACNGTAFVTDRRGSSAFFAAWRPLMFSQVGKAGAQALYHWNFDADAQYGEVDYNTAAPELSYWVDYWLGRNFPSPPGASLLQYSSTDDTDIEVLPVRNSDGTVVVMIVDYAVANASDDNGTGLPRTVSLDVSALGTFSSVIEETIDANTNVSNGPTPATVAFTTPITVTLNGYGVTFLTLSP